MKKAPLTIVSILFYSTIFAQQTNTCLFIGTFEKNKRGICGDYELVHKEIKDNADYNIKRIQFLEEHKGLSPNTRFIDKNESVICYQYEKKISGWNCNSNVISNKTGKSIEDCNKQLAKQQAENPKDFTTQPKIIFTWQGKGNDLNTYSEDFGGLNGKFTSGSTATQTIIVAQFTNKTKDKLARVSLKTANGTQTVEFIYPGESFSKKYETENLDIKVIYLDSKKPKPTDDVINKIKNFVRKGIINENGQLKSMPSSTITGVRG
jgi:hypothetical protein